MQISLPGILIGGVLAACFYGVANVFVKLSEQAGATGNYIILFFGIGTLLLGVLYSLVTPQSHVNLAAGMYATLGGVIGGMGIVSVSYALYKFQIPLSVINPIYNANTLITVLLSLWLFAEWKQVQVPRLLFGSALIVIGTIIVAQSS